MVPKANKQQKLLDIEPLELAQQLTITESKLFSEIQPSECLSRVLNGKSGDSNDNVSASIDNTNKLAAWVADSILSKEDAKKRAAIVKYFIDVADHCRLLQNYSTMAALVGGLNSAPVRRLNRTWEEVNARSKSQLQEAELIIDINNNFANFQVILKNAQLPCIPFFGVYLTSLKSIPDGNKNMIQSDVIQEIKHYQSKPYNLTVVPTIQDFIGESLSAQRDISCSGDRTWRLSLEREPRASRDETMAQLFQGSGFL